MVNKYIKEIKEYTCGSCGYVWIAKKQNPVKCPRCQKKLSEITPKIRITRTETIKKVLLV